MCANDSFSETKRNLSRSTKSELAKICASKKRKNQPKK